MQRAQRRQQLQRHTHTHHQQPIRRNAFTAVKIPFKLILICLWLQFALASQIRSEIVYEFATWSNVPHSGITLMHPYTEWNNIKIKFMAVRTKYYRICAKKKWESERENEMNEWREREKEQNRMESQSREWRRSWSETRREEWTLRIANRWRKTARTKQHREKNRKRKRSCEWN